MEFFNQEPDSERALEQEGTEVMIEIQLKLWGRLKQYLSASRDLMEKEKWEIKEGTTIGDILKALNIPEDLGIVPIVNGSNCFDKERVLKDGDTIHLYPLISGG
jgi:sulfur carrier protein ThiS